MPTKKQSAAQKEYKMVFKVLSKTSNALFDKGHYETATLYYSALASFIKEEENHGFSTPEQLANVIWNQAMALSNWAKALPKNKLVQAANQLRESIVLIVEAKNTYSDENKIQLCAQKILELDAFLRNNRPTHSELFDDAQSMDILEQRSSPVMFINKGKSLSEIPVASLPLKKRYGYTN